jgi:two-component system sensor histidine kinase PhoQ
MNSIHFRLLLAASLVLAGFLLAGGVALEQGFRSAAEDAERDKLQSVVYGLLAAAKVDEQGGMMLPDSLPEPRFSSPDSGLYALVLAGRGEVFWRSPSMLGLELPKVGMLPPGKTSFARKGRLFVHAQGIAWEDDRGNTRRYTYLVAEDAAAFETQIQAFRLSLWSWLGGMAVVLLLVQGMILRWGLRPLRQVEKDLEDIREGLRSRLEGVYPAELQGLVSSLNSLMAHSRAVQERYRTSLDDLAHSLKTPMAYLKTVVQDESLSCERVRRIADEQLQRLDYIVQHQLRRAAVSARSTLVAPVVVAPMIQRLLVTLEKIYAEKGICVENRVESDALFRGDEADLMELLGNLLENAFKYGHSWVGVSAWNQEGLRLVIEDDGPGISSGEWPRVLRRGQRADENNPGQGIGLAVAWEIIGLYGGSLEAGQSEAGGLRLELRFPESPAYPGNAQ